jgi:hypothetical protein
LTVSTLFTMLGREFHGSDVVQGNTIVCSVIPCCAV